MKKINITVKAPKPRDYDHYLLQVKGLLRTKVIKNKKKKKTKFNLDKEISHYSNIYLNKCFNNGRYFLLDILIQLLYNHLVVND